MLACGGFHPHYGFGGEEHLLAVDMAAAGWGLAYADQVVAHHEPATGSRGSRADDELRNRLWSTWLRRPLPSVLRVTIAIAVGERSGARALLAALWGIPWVLNERSVVPMQLERSLRLLEMSARARSCAARSNRAAGARRSR